MLCIGTGDAVQGAQRTHAVGCADCADTADPGVAIGGVGGVQLIAASNPVDVSIVDDRVVHGKRVIAGNAEDIVYPNRFQAPEHMLSDSFIHCFLQP